MDSNTNDILLWDAFRTGDKHALGTLFDNYFSEMFRYGSKINSDIELVKDCIQEIFIEIWNQKSPQPIISVKAYFLKALKYKLIRVAKKNHINTTESEHSPEHFQISHEAFLIQEHLDREKSSKLLTALNQLPDRQREIVYLKYYLDLSYEEICDIMNIQYQVARNQVSTSIKTMKRLLIIALIVFSVVL